MLTKDDKKEIRNIMVEALGETVMPVLKTMQKTIDTHSKQFEKIDERFEGMDDRFKGLEKKIDNNSYAIAEQSIILDKHTQHFTSIDNKLDKHEGMIYKLIEDVDDIKTEMIMGNDLRKIIKGNLSTQKNKITSIDSRVLILENS